MPLSADRPTPAPATADDLADLSARLDAVLSHLSTLTATGARWMTVETAAGYSGLSAVSVRRLLASRRLTAHRPVKGRVLVDRREIDALIQSSTGRPSVGRGRRRCASEPADVRAGKHPVS